MQDIIVNNNQIEINNGDFVLGKSQNQSVEFLLVSKPGEWKQHPQTGCDIIQAKNGVIDRFLDREIRVQLEADGFEIEKMNLTPKGLELDGNYH